MLIWSGLGFLTALIIVLGLALGVVLDPMVQQAAPGLPPETGFAIGIVAAAVANWFLGVWLNNRPGRELIDVKTGQRVVLRRRHRLFWIPMQYYSVAFLVLAVAAMFSRAIPDGLGGYTHV